MREEKVHLAVSRKYNKSLPSWRAAKEDGLVSGANIIVWGLQWGSPSSQMADSWPHAEKVYLAHGVLEDPKGQFGGQPK